MMILSDWLSFLSGVALVAVGLCVLWAYWPRRDWAATAAGVLNLGIWFSFLAAVSNTLYWQVFGQPSVYTWDLLTVAELRLVGDYGDVMFKGGHAVAGLLFLWALRLAEKGKDQ